MSIFVNLGGILYSCSMKALRFEWIKSNLSKLIWESGFSFHDATISRHFCTKRDAEVIDTLTLCEHSFFIPFLIEWYK